MPNNIPGFNMTAQMPGVQPSVSRNPKVNPAFYDPPVKYEPVYTRPSPKSKMVSDFLGMDIENQRKVLIKHNVPFAGMDMANQTRALNNLKEDTINVASLFGKGAIPVDAPEYTTAQKIYLASEPYVRPLAQAGGMTAGGLAGMPVAPPFGTIAGASLGYGIAENLFKMTEGVLGLREPQGIVREAQEAVRDIQEGAVYEMGGQLLGPVLHGVKSIVKTPLSRLAKKTTLTQTGAKIRAKKILTEQLRGTELTQPQIDRNVIAGKKLQAKIRKEVDPNFTLTQGQLTDDASTIALERTLARRVKGLDLTQEQRQLASRSLDTYYNKKVLSSGTTEDFIAYTERMSKEIEQSTKQAVNAVEAEVARLSRHIEPQVFSNTILKNLSASKAEMKKEASKLYDVVPDMKLGTKRLIKDVRGYVLSEDNLIRGRTREIIGLIKKKALKKTGAEVTKTINPATGKVTVIDKTDAIPIKYSVLRKIQSNAKELHREAMGGVNPDLKDARQLSSIIDYLEGAMAQVKKVNPTAGKAYDKATKFYGKEYIPSYRQGTVADVLQRGARGEETRIAKAQIAGAFDSLDGVDDFMRVAGDNIASKTAMKDYYSYSLINKAVDGEGKVKIKAAQTWLSNNKGKLKKLGIDSEFDSLSKLQGEVDDLISKRDVFNKSVAGKVMEADVARIISNAYSGSKNYPETTRQLLKLTKDNIAATQGLKKSFADFLLKRVESARPAFYQTTGGTTAGDIEFLKNVSKMNRVFTDFLPSMKIMYKNEPKKLQAVLDMWEGLRTVGRTSSSPVGAGSPTAELIFGEQMISRGGAMAVGRIRPAIYYPFIVVTNWMRKRGIQNVEPYLTRMMFDPEYAEIALNIVRSYGKPSSFTQKAFSRLARNVGIVSIASPEKTSNEVNEKIKKQYRPIVSQYTKQATNRVVQTILSGGDGDMALREVNNIPAIPGTTIAPNITMSKVNRALKKTNFGLSGKAQNKQRKAELIEHYTKHGILID